LQRRDDAEGAVDAVETGHGQQPRACRGLCGVHRGLSFRVEGNRQDHAGQQDVVDEGQDGKTKNFGHADHFLG
jgi:hypothetical protein